MERSSRNFQPSASNRKQQAIYASPNRYFSVNSGLVPPGYMISCNSGKTRKVTIYTKREKKKLLFVLRYFAYIITFQNISVSNFFLTLNVLVYILKLLIMGKKGAKFLMFKGRGGRFQRKKFANRLRLTKNCSE